MFMIRRVVGSEILPFLPEVARLRIEVFREFPYLYDGSESYERGYLEHYASIPQSLCVLAFEGDRVIGASTGMPLAESLPEFRRPFQDAGLVEASIFYFGESVLEKSHRGKGIGHRFFDERETHAFESGFSTTAFCAVERPDDHPLKPEDYRSNTAFWTKRGYVIHTDLKARLSWEQVDSPDEVWNDLAFWVRSAGEAPQ